LKVLQGEGIMKLICISASNTRLIGNNSTSIKVGDLIKKITYKQVMDRVDVQVLPLVDYNLETCILCGNCNISNRCVYDKEFNRLLNMIEEADGIVFIVPHYSPIPAKLIMMFEKLNEIMYSGWLKNSEYRASWSNKPVAVIGHGAMVESLESLSYYYDQLVARVADTLRSLTFQIIGANDEHPNGVCFGLKNETCLRTREDAVFPDIQQDWEMIEERIEPLVQRLLRIIA
jgi:multimeric flavodoxin WrbA